MATTTTTTTSTFLSNSLPEERGVNSVSQYDGLTTTDPTASNVTQLGSQVQLQSIPSPPVFADKEKEREYLKGRLALAFRIFAKNGFDEGLAGHITLRDPILTDHFWVNPLGRAFCLMRRSDLILVNSRGEVVDGGPNRLLNRAAYMIHHAIHVARPDVNCAAHSHSIYGKAFCSLGREVSMLSQDSCAFYKDVGMYKQFNGAVLAKEEGEHIAVALGPKKACLLQNHGLLSCGQTVEAATYWFYALDRACHVQLMAEAVPGGPKPIDDEDAEFTYKSTGTPGIGWFQAQPMFEVMALESGEHYLQ